ncbi:acylamino-acid-releasing enzyme isoform X1 [Capsella rubella]|uniref:acylamino-acid-releasing enzyme isoform X1 n=1 Tax=Capsella rubella TaxID=81985 RepID=UPI000CD4E551|nr:acylamino-acid-releasing enzyme isoform X1 [Capsella rubella]
MIFRNRSNSKSSCVSPTLTKLGFSSSQAMFAMSQANLLANKRRKFLLSTHISKESRESVKFHWSPFPVEMNGVSAFVPSPSGLKLLVVRNSENVESPTHFEIWSSCQLEKEFHITQKVHGSIYVDGWFEGISWNSDETHVAYVAEEPLLSKPTFNHLGYKKGDSFGDDFGSWKGQVDWEDEWGEAYAGKRQPAMFVINLDSGKVQPIKGIPRSLSVGQVIWSPNSKGSDQYLVFVGWSGGKRKLGIKYCSNRPCAIYTTKFTDASSSCSDESKNNENEACPLYNWTKSISSGFSPRFSKDGKLLMFLSSKGAVDSGAHRATESLHRINWPSDGNFSETTNILNVIQVVKYAEDGCFPGLYSSRLLSDPWLSDEQTLVLSSFWRSCQVILAVNLLSGEVSRVSPSDSNHSWNIVALDGDDIVAVCSSLVKVPEIKYGKKILSTYGKLSWQWLNISSPIFKCPDMVMLGLSSLQFEILEIPVSGVSEDLTEGAKKPIEAIYVSASKSDKCDPLVVVIHGGPHSLSPSSFSNSLAYLSSIGNSLLIVNYRGSLGFDDDALQSLPGKVGSQDVQDVLTAVDYAIDMGFADASRITLLGGSHGGFLTTHLIGQAPDKFVAAVARNHVCNLASMVGISDIPDWCFFEAYGDTNHFTEAPSPDDLSRFHQMSPISHVSKVKTPTLFLLGTKDLRVPVSNGLQYVRALKEKGVQIKVLVFPNDNHPLDRPQTNFESFLNIGCWFKKYCKQ